MSNNKAKKTKAAVAEPPAVAPDLLARRRAAIETINARETEAERAQQAIIERRLDSVADLIHQNEESRKAFLAELPKLERALKTYLQVDWKGQRQTSVWSRIMTHLTSSSTSLARVEATSTSSACLRVRTTA